MTNDGNADILRRVQKLLAIAQDTRADPNEAAAAARMAGIIMHKYQISESETLVATLQRGDDLTEKTYVATAKTNGTKVRAVPAWAQWMAVGVAKLMDCGARVTYTVDGEAAIKFCGYTQDVQVSIWMFDYLVKTVLRLNEAYKTTDAYKRFGRTNLNSYRTGVATGICAALTEAKREKDAANATSNAGRSLVVVKADAIEKRFGGFGYATKKHVTRSAEAFSRGLQDGKKVDVSRRAVENKTSSTEFLN
jgi:hypothetical protein